MRRLIGLVGVFALIWCGWWLFAVQSLQDGIGHWLEDRRSEGWQAEVSGMRKGGFPLRLDAVLENPALADPQTGVAFTASQLQISAATWWPGHVMLIFPEDEMVLASPLDRRTITADSAQANLRLRVGTAQEVEEMSLTSGSWRLDAPAGSLMAAQGVTLNMMQAAEDRTTYDITFDAPAFQPGSLPRAALRVPDNWPIAFDSLALDMRVRFDRPIDRATIETARPQPRRIDLQRAEAVWGETLLRAAAALDVAETGVLDGEVSLQARNWRELLTLAETAGVLPAALRPQMETILGALARGSGNPDALDLRISIREGTMLIGFIPIGPAPRLILR